MKKIGFMSIIFLCCILLGGCAGREKEGEAWRGVQAGMEDLTELIERTEYYDIISESEDVFQSNPGDADTPLGAQFYSGEPIRLCAKGSDIYLFRTDGSGELLLQGVPAAYTLFNYSSGWCWYFSREGDFYCWRRANYSVHHPEYAADDKKTEAALVKISAFGEIMYEKTFDVGVSIEDFCQLSDGRCYLLLQNEVEQTRTLAELEPATGNFTAADKVQMEGILVGNQYLGTADGALAVFNNMPRTGDEIVELNPMDGKQSCILSFTGTTYFLYNPGMTIQDFRALEDGSVEILWMDSRSRAAGKLERLRMAKVEKTPVIVRGNFKADDWLTKLAASFNRQNSTYHVIIEDCGAENDVEDFARLTSIQFAAGKGPDIIQADFMQDYVSGMLEKGVMENLSPYMEKSGIREEDYFPFVFDTWRDGGRIYGINPRMGMTGYEMDESVLGGREEPDIETLVNSLLSWEGSALYMSGMNSRELLKVFLEGTETLWGMVDWEKGNCDFSGGLFAGLLEAAKRYGDDGKKGQLPGIVHQRKFGIFEFGGTAYQESTGKVTCGVLFDDGCHAAVSSQYTMAMNSNSSHKEGAWEFLCFLLGDEVQSPDGGYRPVSRKNFELWLEKQKEQVADGKAVHVRRVTNDKITYVETYTEEDMTDEKIAEYRRTLEDARSYPIRTVPILDIILEEAEDYFSGSKSTEQVSRTAAKRVQLFLDEMR